MKDICYCGRNVAWNRCDACSKAVAEWSKRATPKPMALTVSNGTQKDVRVNRALVLARQIVEQEFAFLNEEPVECPRSGKRQP